MNSHSILFIDDETWYIEPIVERLEYENFKVIHCRTLSEAVLSLNQTIPDLAIVDLLIPIGDEMELKFDVNEVAPGLSLINFIKLRFSSIPILCYSVFNSAAIINELKNLRTTHVSKLSEDDDELYNSIYSLLKKN